MILCFAEEITSLLTKWLQSLESLAAYLTSSSPYPSPNHAHSTQANMDSTMVVAKDDISQHLGKAQRKVTFEEISKAFLGQTYQDLSDVVKTAVGELATLCAEMDVYAFESRSKETAENDKGRDSTVDAEREKDDGLSLEKERELDYGTTAMDSEREKERHLTSSQKERDSDCNATAAESEREKAYNIPSSSSIVKCSSLVDFVRCYGPLLDSVRLKQLLSSKEWGERRECLAALSQAKEAETCPAGELSSSWIA